MTLVNYSISEANIKKFYFLGSTEFLLSLIAGLLYISQRRPIQKFETLRIPKNNEKPYPYVALSIP